MLLGRKGEKRDEGGGFKLAGEQGRRLPVALLHDSKRGTRRRSPEIREGLLEAAALSERRKKQI